MMVLKTQTSCGDVKWMKNELALPNPSLVPLSLEMDLIIFLILYLLLVFKLKKIKETGLPETSMVARK